MTEIGRGEQIYPLITSDVSLFGVQWSDDGRDIVFDLELPQSGRHSLVCTWAASVSIDLQSEKNTGGPPLTSEASFRTIDSGRTCIVFNFFDRGTITFECNEVVLSRSEGSEQGGAGQPATRSESK